MLDSSMDAESADNSRLSPPHADDRMDYSGHTHADIETLFAGDMHHEDEARSCSTSSSSSSKSRNQSSRGLTGKENIDSVF